MFKSIKNIFIYINKFIKSDNFYDILNSFLIKILIKLYLFYI